MGGLESIFLYRHINDSPQAIFSAMTKKTVDVTFHDIPKPCDVIIGNFHRKRPLNGDIRKRNISANGETPVLRENYRNAYIGNVCSFCTPDLSF